MAQTRSFKVFLSAVTSECGRARGEIARDLRGGRGLTVSVQEEFRQEADVDTTLDLLHKHIANLGDKDEGAVVCIIGRRSGDFPPEKAAEKYAHLLPAGFTRASYTQWELFFARHYGRRLSIYLAADDYVPDKPDASPNDEAESQQAFIDHIKREEGLNRTYFSSVHELCRALLREDWPQLKHTRPILLPYHSIGTLFKGREEFLQQLRESLQQTSEHGATAITGRAVHGLGGVGKTRLAVEYALQHADEYSAVLFVTADSPESLRRNLAELVGPSVLDLQEQAATEEEVRVAAALRWLAEHPGWFLILDNVDTEEAAECVEQLLPRLRRGHVLITSRLARWRGQVQPLELDVLAADDAAAFLLQRTEPEGSRGRTITADDADDAAALAADLDGLALALEQAGAYIVARRKSLGEYIQLWRQHDERVQTWHNQREMQYPRSIAVTWQTTLDQLGGDEQTLLNLLAWYDAEPVPQSVFDPSALSASLRFKEEDGNAEDAEAGGESWDEERIEAALANLADFSMIRWEAETATVHRVVQEILRSRQDEPKRWLTGALRLLHAARPKGHAADVRTWEDWERLRPHVAFATAEADQRGIANPTGMLMTQYGQLLQAKALFADAEPVYRRALALIEQHEGSGATGVALALSCVAHLLHATNRLAEAEPLLRRALAIDEQSYGAEHADVARDLNNLSELLRVRNRLAEAEPLMRPALAIDERSLGAEHPNVAIRLNNLAQLLQATNRLAEAEPLMRRALAIDEQSYGAEHPDVARDLNNLAQLLQATNRLAEAEPLMRRALAIDEQSYGAEHPNVATDLNNLAQLLQATNRLAEAEPLMRRALAIDEQSYGAEHPNVATDLNNLAQWLKATNRLAEAEPLMRRALDIFTASLGEDHPHTQTVRANYEALQAELPS